jgi:hypothetical protein
VPSPSELDDQIDAFEVLEDRLARAHPGAWVVVRDRRLEGVFASFDEAAEDAVRRFGRGPYLIRQLGAPRAAVPAFLVAAARGPAEGGRRA